MLTPIEKFVAAINPQLNSLTQVSTFLNSSYQPVVPTTTLTPAFKHL
jgi:hypothetical protein